MHLAEEGEAKSWVAARAVEESQIRDVGTGDLSPAMTDD